MKITLLILLLAIVRTTPFGAQNVVDVNPNLFLQDGVNVIVTTVECTLSDGTKTQCYQITTKSNPTDHQQGPWCPTNIADDASAGGIWLEGGKVYDVDGEFIKNMATFYKDATWQMYDVNTGVIKKTLTQEDCANAANPNVGIQYKNYCVECLPSYVAGLSSTFLIPVSPVYTSSTTQFAMGPGGGNRPSIRGLAFNGVRYDGPAPTNVILAAYTLAPFDDAGGHINPNAGYHYHAATGKSKEIAQCDKHAPMIGYALDGHGIYSMLDMDGGQPTGLDACRGHSDETRGYHYHMDAPGSNNFINCLHGAYATVTGSPAVIDKDNDGYRMEVDCDDNNPNIHPGATEIDGNLIDENCDGQINCDSLTLGVNDLEVSEFFISPNPASDALHLQFSAHQSGPTTMKLATIAGTIVMSATTSSSSHTLDIQGLENGTYFLTVASARGSATRRIVVVR